MLKTNTERRFSIVHQDPAPVAPQNTHMAARHAENLNNLSEMGAEFGRRFLLPSLMSCLFEPSSYFKARTCVHEMKPLP